MRKKICSDDVDARTCTKATSFLAFMVKARNTRYKHHSDSSVFKNDIQRIRDYIKKCSPKNQNKEGQPDKAIAVSSSLAY